MYKWKKINCVANVIFKRKAPAIHRYKVRSYYSFTTTKSNTYCDIYIYIYKMNIKKNFVYVTDWRLRILIGQLQKLDLDGQKAKKEEGNNKNVTKILSKIYTSQIYF